MHLILTSCTNRKRAASPPELRAGSLPQGAPLKVAREWSKRLRKAKIEMTAVDLYAGRTIREAENAATAIGARLLIASAGLGIIDATDLIPAYDLTITGSSVNNVLNQTSTSSPDWWRALSQNSPYHRPLPDFDGLLLIALPADYLSMIAPTLEALSSRLQARMRIFTKPPKGQSGSLWSEAWMPYDDRLDLLGTPYAGTQGDFAQRALRHYVETILPAAKSPTADSERVRKALRGLTLPETSSRLRLMDQEIIDLMLRDWSVAGGSASRMLRHLRDTLSVSCEQRRVQGLYALAVQKRDAGRKP